MNNQKERSLKSSRNNVYFTAPGMYYKGDWIVGRAYSPQNCVTVRTGVNAGLYICIAYISSSANSPGTSNGDGNLWLKIAALEAHPMAE